MALNKAKLQADLVNILNNPQTTNNVNTVAAALANAIDQYVKTGNAIGVDSRGDTCNLKIQ